MSSSGQRFRVSRINALSSLIAWVLPVAEFGSSAQIFSTADGGRTWRGAAVPPPAGLPGVLASSISFINSREGWLLASLGAATGSEEVVIYRSTDGGEKWILHARSAPYNTSSGIPFGSDKSTIAFLNPTTGLITGVTASSNTLILYVTHDGGRTWQDQNLPLPPSKRWRAYPQVPKFFSEQDGILPVYYLLRSDLGQETEMIVAFYATHDSGNTWTYATPGPVGASEVAHGVADINHLWLKQGNVVYATTDGGRQWTTIPRNPLFASVIQMDFISPQAGWALRYEFPFLLRTLDGGRTWTTVTYAITR